MRHGVSAPVVDSTSSRSLEVTSAIIILDDAAHCNDLALPVHIDSQLQQDT